MIGSIPVLIKVEVSVPAEVHKKGDWWISSCPVLDVCSQGRTKEEAMSNLEEALALFVDSCVERGTLFDVLREAGFERVSEEAAEQESACNDDDTLLVSIPLPFMISARHHGGPNHHA